MHLVQALSCGVRGAERGSAFFTYTDDEGNSVPLMVYADHAGKTRRGSSVDLDDWGSAQVFVSRLANVFVLSESGAIVCIFTASAQSKSVETLSTITKSSDSEYAPVPNVVSVHPGSYYRQLDELLELVGAGFGWPDWYVIDRGNPVRLQDAFSTRLGYFYDVSSDTYAGSVAAAIDAAAAAGGGIVYIPAGTFELPSEKLIPETVSIMGVCGNSSVVKITGEGGLRVGESVFGRGNFIENISIMYNDGSSGNLLTLSPGAKCRLLGCGLYGDANLAVVSVEDDDDRATLVTLENCVLSCGSSTLYAIESMSVNPATSVRMSGGAVSLSPSPTVYSQLVGTNLRLEGVLFYSNNLGASPCAWFHRNGAARLNVIFSGCTLPALPAVNAVVAFDIGNIVDGDFFSESQTNHDGNAKSLVEYTIPYIGSTTTFFKATYAENVVIGASPVGYKFFDDAPVTMLSDTDIIVDFAKKRVRSFRVDGYIPTFTTPVRQVISRPSGPVSRSSDAYLFLTIKDSFDANTPVYPLTKPLIGNDLRLPTIPANAAIVATPTVYCGFRLVRTTAFYFASGIEYGNELWFSTSQAPGTYGV